MRYVSYSIFVLVLACNNDSSVKRYDGEGILLEEVFLNGQDSTKISYAEDGDTLFIRYFESGSLVRALSFSNNEVLIDRNFSSPNDYSEVAYYPGGRVRVETSFRDGKRHGLERSYYSNGQLRVEATFELGEPVGEFNQYHENGQLYIHADTMGNGMTYVYDSLGNLIDELRYQNFELVK